MLGGAHGETASTAAYSGPAIQAYLHTAANPLQNQPDCPEPPWAHPTPPPTPSPCLGLLPLPLRNDCQLSARSFCLMSICWKRFLLL